jgi:5-methylcytosine-specific restriction endonuclease McrA
MSDTAGESVCEQSYEEVYADLDRRWIENHPPINETPEEIKRREREEKKRIKDEEKKQRILDKMKQKPGEGFLGDVPLPSLTKVTKIPRPPIGKRLKNDVWHKYIGENIFEHKCLCCKLRTIKRDTFECGHVVSHACGGPTTIPNLRPICMLCNRSMGTTNMIDFVISNQYFIG